MPRRKTPLVTGQFYHVYNRGVNRKPMFLSDHDYRRAILSLRYYQYGELPLKLSHLLSQNQEKRLDIFSSVSSGKKLASILAYCLMPNHFHLLLRQNVDGGISKFLGNFQNSYTKAFNARHRQQKILMGRQFKSTHIETEDQLLHVSRYIHLNPFVAGLIRRQDIFTFPWSSAAEYENGIQDLTETMLPNNMTTKQYVTFVYDHADYQKRLGGIKHLLFDAEVLPD